ncbi:MAG: 23S rRNA (pseudouridine(1915)-N(3))-methyltransferase RlmH [Thermoanaerobaculia bacterium]
MLAFRFIWVGKSEEGEYARGIERYRARLSRWASVEEVVIRPERDRDDAAARREGARILDALRGRVVVLDERGRMKSSEEFAKMLANHRERDPRPLSFVVGGASGVSPEVVSRADEVLSLSRLTFPHQVARLLLVEQVYRALSIQAGLSYHRPLSVKE